MAGSSAEVYDVCQYVCPFGGRLCCCWNGITVNKKNELLFLPMRIYSKMWTVLSGR